MKDTRSKKMKALDKAYQELKKQKPMKESKHDIFFNSKLKKWDKEISILHNEICNQAIKELNN